LVDSRINYVYSIIYLGNSILDESSRLVSLWDIVKRFDLSAFVEICAHIHAAQVAADSMRSSGGIHPQIDCAKFIPLCEKIIAFGFANGFRHTSIKGHQVKDRMEINPGLFDSSSFAAEMRSLEGDLASDMMDCIFVQVVKDASPFFENPELLGPGVLQGFPTCREDIVSAGNCIAVGLGTAAVFHLMRIAEMGLRAFARSLGLTRVVADKRRGKSVPMEYAQWEKILNQLGEKIDSKIARTKPGPSKQKLQEFYYSALNEISSFKDAWRNHVMHVRRTYSLEDAAAVTAHVRRFMESLAEHGITSRKAK
jgi:hypothetical protein